MIRFATLERLGAPVAAFSEKSDGDCGLNGASNPLSVVAARQAICRSCGVDADRLVCAQQVHGDRTVRVGESDAGCGARDWATGMSATDGLATVQRGLPLGILVADCVPVYLFEPLHHVGALVHAGRAGVFQNISGQAVAFMAQELGARADKMHAVIGPSAGPCCYEVSNEIAGQFAGIGLLVSGRHLDLWQANVRQLVQAGLPESQIEVSGLCTICSDRFHSYRADPQAGRNLALLVL